MSKHLMKILSICAIVILIPLIIIGAALCVTEVIPCTLTIYQAGNEGDYQYTDSSKAPFGEISIFIDGVEQVDKDGNLLTKITVKKHTEVKVVFDESSSKGYDFQGWYNGTPKEINDKSKVKETNPSYTFFIRGNTSLTAIRNVKTYTVQYSGYYNDGTAIADDDSIIKTASLQYNEPLLILSPKQMEGMDNSVLFKGWYVEGSSGEVVREACWDTSTIEGQNYVLNAVWSNQMTVIYYNTNRERIATNYFTSSNYSNKLLSWNDDYNKYLTLGYEFSGWVDAEGKEYVLPQEFTEGIYSIFLKETPKKYNITIEKSEIDKTVATISFNVVDKFQSGLPFERDYYNFVGLIYEGNLYKYTVAEDVTDYIYNETSLSDIILQKGNITVHAKWESKYQEGDWEIRFRGPKVNGKDTIIYYFDGDEYISLEDYSLGGLDYDITIDDAEGCYQWENKLIDVYDSIKGLQIENWDNLQLYCDLDQDGIINPETEKVSIYSYSIVTNTNLISVPHESIVTTLYDGSLGEVMAFINENPEIFGYENFEDINQIFITFNFVEKN